MFYEDFLKKSDLIDYFFEINNKTKEKIHYLKKNFK